MNIFITGATGFLGQYLIRELSPNFETIYILSRNSQFTGFNDLPNVKIVKGDITQLEIIEDIMMRDLILEESDFVIHAAALYDLKASHSDCYLQNIVGTQNTLRLVKKMKKLKALYYISTIAVGDDQSFFLEEDHLPVRKKFNDFYSETKYFAEKIVRETQHNGATRIIRPGIIIGDSKTGKMDKIDGPYYFIEAMKKYSTFLKSIPFIPLSFNPRTKIPIIPVDHCARYISLLIGRDLGVPELKTYHLISNEVPTVKQFLDDLNEAFSIKTQYIPVFKNPVHNSVLKLLGIPKELVPFMFSKLSYDKTRTIEELPEMQESTYSAFKGILFLKTL
ncbi:MAG: SDR family oxidoreductase [Bacteriovorax sp.]|nr:SDR family oxidoreductase [Bacteriovorax sp.]